MATMWQTKSFNDFRQLCQLSITACNLAKCNRTLLGLSTQGCRAARPVPPAVTMTVTGHATRLGALCDAATSAAEPAEQAPNGERTKTMTQPAQRQATILADLTQPVVTVDVNSELERLKAENAALKAQNAARNKVTCKVSEKGALSIYGFGRFPATFYISQWDSLIANLDSVKAFVAANRGKFASKAAKA